MDQAVNISQDNSLEEITIKAKTITITIDWLMNKLIKSIIDSLFLILLILRENSLL